MNDEDVPQLRLNAQYRKMLDRDNGATKEVRNYVKERYASAHPADEEHRAAEADHPEGLPVDRAAADRVSGARASTS